MSSDVRSPNGWLNLINSRITRWLVVGTLAAGGSGAVAFYGQFQGAQAGHFCEARLTATSTTGKVSYSCLNPLPEGTSGAIIADPANLVVIARNPLQATKLNVCTASGAAQPCTKVSGGSNVMSGVIIGGAKRLLSLTMTGGMVPVLTSSGANAGGYNAAWPVKNSFRNGTPYVVLAPRNYSSPARKYLNFTFLVGSGATANGSAPAFVRFEILPCNLSGVGC